MKKIRAWWQVVKQDAAAFASSPTITEDIANLKADAEAMLPEIFNELEAAFAKLLLATL